MAHFVKIVVYVPSTHAAKIRHVLAASGCGRIGKYDSCSFSVKGFGRFRPLKGARPYAGTKGKIHKIAEERIETVCPKRLLEKILSAIKEAHPYEEPAIDVLSLL